MKRLFIKAFLFASQTKINNGLAQLESANIPLSWFNEEITLIQKAVDLRFKLGLTLSAILIISLTILSII